MKLVSIKRTDDQMIRNRIDCLIDSLNNSNEDYIYELICMIENYIATFENDPMLDDAWLAIKLAKFNYIMYCVENEIDKPKD